MTAAADDRDGVMQLADEVRASLLDQAMRHDPVPTDAQIDQMLKLSDLIAARGNGTRMDYLAAALNLVLGAISRTMDEQLAKPGESAKVVTDVEGTMGNQIDEYGVRTVLLNLARALQSRGLRPLAGKLRAMLPED